MACRALYHRGLLVYRLDFLRQSGGCNRACSFTDTFAGIRPVDLPGFIVAEFVGAAIALALFSWLLKTRSETAPRSAATSAR